METTAKFSISVVGEESLNPYVGDFTVKTLLSMRDKFRADELRRLYLGINPDSASASAIGEAMVLAQLNVRIVEGPDWWNNSDGGLSLSDNNVIGEIFKLALDKENERKNDLKKKANEATDKLKKK